MSKKIPKPEWVCFAESRISILQLNIAVVTVVKCNAQNMWLVCLDDLILSRVVVCNLKEIKSNEIINRWPLNIVVHCKKTHKEQRHGTMHDSSVHELQKEFFESNCVEVDIKQITLQSYWWAVALKQENYQLVGRNASYHYSIFNFSVASIITMSLNNCC